MNLIYVASEIFPFAKTGGLADVAGSLPIALKNEGCDVKLFMPKYSLIDEEKYNIKPIKGASDLTTTIGGIKKKFGVFSAKLPNADIECFFIDSPEYFHRETLYTNDSDEDERFILFNKAVIETLIHLNLKADIINVNDWQTSLIPYYLKENYSLNNIFSGTRTVLTIHNIGYQGRFNEKALEKAEISSDYFYPGGPAEFYGDVNFLKLGIIYADLINTVSRTYAEEILTAEFGEGLSGVLLTRRSDLFGILNGIDDEIWNPETDKYIRKNYNFHTIENKLENKKQLAREMGFEFNPDIPIVAMVSRMAVQKGFDILIDTFPYLLEENAIWVILGNGESEYENFLRALALELPDKLFVHIGYNDRLAHIIEAGTDIFLMPSKYEPCGLNQMYSLKYGSVPVVRKTGGLADTVFDWDEMKSLGNYDGNGFSFENYNGFALHDAIQRALNYFKLPDLWKLMQKNGMQMDFSWDSSARKYLALYRHALKKER